MSLLDDISCIISNDIQLNNVLAFMLSLFLRCFQPVLFCSISLASFRSGRIG